MRYLPYFIFFKSKHIPLIVGLEVIARLEPRRLCFALVNRYHAMLLFRKKKKGSSMVVIVGLLYRSLSNRSLFKTWLEILILVLEE